MAIRTVTIALLSLPLAACAEALPPALPDAAPAPAAPPEPRPQGDAFCDHRLYRCMPNHPSAQQLCDYACLFPSHCQDYRPGDYRYCALHPDSFDPYYRYCDAWGNPSWETSCVAGPRP